MINHPSLEESVINWDLSKEWISVAGIEPRRLVEVLIYPDTKLPTIPKFQEISPNMWCLFLRDFARVVRFLQKKFYISWLCSQNIAPDPWNMQESVPVNGCGGLKTDIASCLKCMVWKLESSGYLIIFWQSTHHGLTKAHTWVVVSDEFDWLYGLVVSMLSALPCLIRLWCADLVYSIAHHSSNLQWTGVHVLTCDTACSLTVRYVCNSCMQVIHV